MIKKTHLASVLLLSTISIACNNTTQSESKPLDVSPTNKEIKEQLSQDDLALIKQSNLILEKLSTEDTDKVKNELKAFIPQVLKIKNKKAKNTVLMNIFVQSKMYPEALELTDSMLADHPNNAGTQKFKCLLLKNLNRTDQEIKNCYAITASLVKTQLDQIDEKDSLHPYIVWAYYSAMYHAGGDEYKNKLQTIVRTQTDENKKNQFESMYEAEMSEQQLP